MKIKGQKNRFEGCGLPPFLPKRSRLRTMGCGRKQTGPVQINLQGIVQESKKRGGFDDPFSGEAYPFL